MDAGGQGINMPVVHPADIWEESAGSGPGPEMVRFGPFGRNMVL